MLLSQLVNPQFKATFGKIASAALPAKGLWKVKRMAGWLAEQEKPYEEARLELCKRYCEKDEKGEPVLKDNRFQGLENNSEFLKEHEELLKSEVEPKIKFHFEEIEVAGITGNDLLILDELVFEPEETE
jgi:hypothetical protein